MQLSTAHLSNNIFYLTQYTDLVDNHTPEQRRKNMQAIRSKDTSIEILLRKELWKRGLRYQKNCKDLPGHPDIVFKGKKVAVFCDSEFWHGLDWDNRKKLISNNSDYWVQKIEGNIARDNKVTNALTSMGYTVLRFWGNDIKKNTERCADLIEHQLKNRKTIS